MQTTIIHYGKKEIMAQDKNDHQVTKDIFDNEEKQVLKEALANYKATVVRKSNAPAPQQVKMFWAAEVSKIEALERKVA